jgi:competence protein ComFC
VKIRSTGIQPISWNGIRFLPIKLSGSWDSGYALDIHTIKSEFLGINQFGREEFDTKRSKIGEMVYQLKYKNDLTYIDTLAGLSAATIKELLLKEHIIDCILPIPPSNDYRKKQPVLQVAKKIAEIMSVTFDDNLLEKVSHTDQMKNVLVKDRSIKLEGAFTVSNPGFGYSNILLFDDLYESGSTANECVKTLKSYNSDLKVFLVTMTKTGKRYYYG